MIPRMKSHDGFSVTINTTEDCNLRCKYCYEINKKPHSLPFEYAKKFIDFLIDDPDPAGIMETTVNSNYTGLLYQRGIVIDFIGGDSLMDVDLLDKILKYWLYRLYTTNTENTKIWRKNWRASITSNGTLFDNPNVKAFCERWSENLSLGISIDGCPEIHDKYRVFPDGKGTIDVIKKNWAWYKTTFNRVPVSTKSTLGKDSIKYLFKSLKFMHEEMGITQIFQNFVMEDMGYNEEDYQELDKQLSLCVDYVLEHKNDLYWSMIDGNEFGKAHLSTEYEWENKGHCGSGCMPCLGIDGNIYPCFRWLPHTQTKSVPFIVGNVVDGFNNKKAFEEVRQGSCKVSCTKDEKCKTCENESACAYCIAGCYSEFQEFRRTTYICELIKLQVKWARIYQEHLEKCCKNM